MQPLESIYRSNFFARRSSLDWRPALICNGLNHTFKLPQGSTIIDVGCATGDLVKELNIRGYKADGIEGSKSALPYFQTDSIYTFDLRNKIIDPNFQKAYKLAISIEVAEHIEEEFSDNFIYNMIFLSDLIMITAALPGAKGHYHVNCQLPEYWIEKFAKVNYIYEKNLTDKLKLFFEPMQKKKGISQLFFNTLIFKNKV